MRLTLEPPRITSPQEGDWNFKVELEDMGKKLNNGSGQILLGDCGGDILPRFQNVARWNQHLNRPTSLRKSGC